MPALKNDTLLRALRREPTPYTPIWLMRQAGRYLPEYNATRARAGSFMALATTPSLATEVTLQPLARYPLDAAILFSDILTVPDAMGLGLSFVEGEGPRFERTTADEKSIDALAVPDMANLRYVFDAVAEIKRALADSVPLIGFAGSPFTLACYMIEGSGGGDFAKTRQMAYARGDLLQRIVDVNAEAVARYLAGQIAAGADAVMLFDTWGGLLSREQWRRFSLAPMQRVLEQVRALASPDVPSILFTKGAGGRLSDFVDSGADCVGVDWMTDLGEARRDIGERLSIQGNLDPAALLTDPQTVEYAARAVLENAGPQPGHIFNLGHGIMPATPPENVAALVDAVHTRSRENRREFGAPSQNGLDKRPNRVSPK